ncbi:TonB-dependent receptor [Sphingomonas profundi]|uniref:TonB-dependent receptor n=1 Tax=Alterirhizorhabdus profundi TaxID=2681549 RepID=UPI0012E90B72|nr:TonB-dependent receptor [Sphingomonas profundi]
MRKIIVTGASITVLTIAIGAHPAVAQETAAAVAEPVSAASEAAPDIGGLQDIVVTARKRVESLQDVPVSVTALTGEQVQKLDLTSIEKIAARTPDLNVGRASNGSGAQLTLRGIGSSSTSIGIEQSVAVVVDSVYYGQGRIINEGFFDLARVEILKGPQALFFGKNATAGVISLTTADPGEATEVIARAYYEFRSQQLQGELIGSTPITDRLGIRLALRGSKMWDGYYHNVAGPVSYNTTDIATGALNLHTAQPGFPDGPHEKELLGRLTVKWEPADTITNTLKISGDYNNNDSSSWNYLLYNCPTGSNALNPSYKCGYARTTHQNRIPQDIAAAFPNAKASGLLYNAYRSFAATNTLAVKLDDIGITNVTNYNWNRNSFTCACDYQSSPNGTYATERSPFHSFSNELRVLTSYDGPINLLAGMLYQKTKRDYTQAVMFANIEDSRAAAGDRYLALRKVSSTAGETLAGFGQVIWKVVPTIEATAGVRYTHETKDSNFTQAYVNGALTGLFRPTNAADGLGFVTANQTFNNWSPEATITWKPQKGVLVYGAYKTAYKSGGFSNGGLNSQLSSDPRGDLAFNPERARGFEAGIKTTSFDNQLRFNVGLYTYRYADLQVDFFNSSVFAFQTLTAQARTRGIETEFEFAPRAVPGINLHGSVNYNRARYTSFIGPCYAGQSIAEGCSMQFSAASGGFTRQDLGGTALSVAPRWTGTLGASYDREIGGGFKVGGTVDARYSASYLASSFGNEDSRQHRYVSLDASVRLASADYRWEIAAIGKNLTDRAYVSGGIDGPSTGSGTGTASGVHADQAGFGNLPRTVQLQATLRY